MNDLRKDGKPVVPLCKDCKYFLRGGFALSAMCSSEKRTGDFDPVYGWRLKFVDPYKARERNNDCGIAGNFFEEIPKPEPVPPPAPEKRSIINRIFSSFTNCGWR